MFATDAGGCRPGFQCVLFGPGSMRCASPNELMPAGGLRQAGELLDGLVHRRCLVE